MVETKAINAIYTEFNELIGTNFCFPIVPQSPSLLLLLSLTLPDLFVSPRFLISNCLVPPTLASSLLLPCPLFPSLRPLPSILFASISIFLWYHLTISSIDRDSTFLRLFVLYAQMYRNIPLNNSK